MKKTSLQLKLIMLLTVLWSTAFTQSPIFSYIADINSQMANIPVVFEGQVQSVRVFAGDEYGNPLTSADIVWNGEVGYWHMANGKQGFGYSEAIIKVCKLYKGEIRFDADRTFRVLTKTYALHNIYRMKQDNGTGGKDKYTYVPAEHSRFGMDNEQVILPADAYSKSIYFCYKVDPIIPTNYAAQTHYYSNFKTAYEMAYDYPVTIPQPGGDGIKMNAYCTLFGYVFNDQAEMQLFLSYINGVNPNPDNYCKDDGTSHEKIVKKPEPIKIDYAQNVKNYDARMELLKSKININASSGHKSSSITDLTLAMANERILESGGDNWFEFDVMASTNQPSVYFDNCLMRIQYNTAAFGSNAMSSSNVTITRVGGFNTTTYTNPQSQSIDQTSNTLGIPFGTDFAVAAWNRVLLSGTPIKMLTVRMKILFCGQPANLTFVDQPTTSILSFFATTATANIVNTVSFDNTNYNGNITDNVCEPLISGFTNNIPAGIGRHLTITGKYFGPSMGDGTVIFKDSDWGTVYPPYNNGVHNCGIQPYDVVSWSDNQIVIKLPSIIDSAKTWTKINNVLVPANGIDRVYPGSGKFIVQNFTLSRKESSTALNIPFSLSNVIAPNTQAPTGLYRKKQVKLAGPDSQGFNVRFNTNVATFNSNIKPVFRRAMKNWTCVTGINWTIGTDVTAGGVLNDYIHEVLMGPNNMDPSVIMQTNNGIAVCVNNGVETWYKATFDMMINPNTTWAYDTTGASLANGTYDFFQCAMHELGHAHNVFHINDSLNDLMFWAQNVISVASPTRKSVYTSSGAVSGGQHVTDSLIGGITCVTNQLLLNPTYCHGAPNGIRKVQGQLVDISVYPNPSEINQNINVHFTLQSEQKVSFQLYGITGNLIRSVAPVSYSDEVDYVFDTGNLSAGMYLLTVNIGNKQETFKLIKQ